MGGGESADGHDWRRQNSPIKISDIGAVSAGERETVFSEVQCWYCEGSVTGQVQEMPKALMVTEKTEKTGLLSRGRSSGGSRSSIRTFFERVIVRLTRVRIASISASRSRERKAAIRT